MEHSLYNSPGKYETVFSLPCLALGLGELEKLEAGWASLHAAFPKKLA